MQILIQCLVDGSMSWYTVFYRYDNKITGLSSKAKELPWVACKQPDEKFYNLIFYNIILYIY